MLIPTHHHTSRVAKRRELVPFVQADGTFHFAVITREPLAPRVGVPRDVTLPFGLFLILAFAMDYPLAASMRPISRATSRAMSFARAPAS